MLAVCHSSVWIIAILYLIVDIARCDISLKTVLILSDVRAKTSDVHVTLVITIIISLLFSVMSRKPTWVGCLGR